MEHLSRNARMAALGVAMQAYQRSTDLLDDVAADFLDVNRTDLRCLDFLSEGPQTVGQIAEAVALSSAATTTLLDRLEQKGLVRRTPDPSDRRKVLVEMSQRGESQVRHLYEPLVVDGMEMLERYGDDELELLRGFVELCTELNHRHRARIAQELRRSAPA